MKGGTEGGIRAGRVTPNLLDHVSIPSEVGPIPLKQLAVVTARTAQLLTVKPFDEKAVDVIFNALKDLELDVIPRVENKMIMLPLAKPSVEQRNALIKSAKDRAEKAKVVSRC